MSLVETRAWCKVRFPRTVERQHICLNLRERACAASHNERDGFAKLDRRDGRQLRAMHSDAAHHCRTRLPACYRVPRAIQHEPVLSKLERDDNFRRLRDLVATSDSSAFLLQTQRQDQRHRLRMRRIELKRHNARLTGRRSSVVGLVALLSANVIHASRQTWTTRSAWTRSL